MISSAGLQHYSVSIHKIHTTNEIKEIESLLADLGIIKKKRKWLYSMIYQKYNKLWYPVFYNRI